MTEQIFPDHPHYAAHVAALIAKAATMGYRLAEPWERERLPTDQLYSFSTASGRMCAPVFVRQEGGTR